MPTYEQATQQFLPPKTQNQKPKPLTGPSPNLPLEFGLTLDSSSSMLRLREAVLGGINFLIGEQKPPTKFSFTSFASEVEFVHRNVPVHEVRLLEPADYRPYGNTALLDGIGAMIQLIGAVYDPAPVNLKPRVLIAILTDGDENHSHRFSHEDIKRLIHYRRTGSAWQFLFLTADYAGEQFGLSIGIQRSNIIRFSTDPAAMTALLERLSKSVAAFQLGDRNFAKFMLENRKP